MLGCLTTLQFGFRAALAGLTVPVVFTLAGAFFVLLPTFYSLRYSLRWSPFACCVGVLITGTTVGWLVLGAPSEELFGPLGKLGAQFGTCTAVFWVIFYYLPTWRSFRRQ